MAFKSNFLFNIKHRWNANLSITIEQSIMNGKGGFRGHNGFIGYYIR
mgnify:CR=1 FL=1